MNYADDLKAASLREGPPRIDFIVLSEPVSRPRRSVKGPCAFCASAILRTEGGWVCLSCSFVGLFDAKWIRLERETTIWEAPPLSQNSWTGPPRIIEVGL